MFFAEPMYQSSAKIPDPVVNGQPWRAVPDVALDADPYTGVEIILNGGASVGNGGTSLSTPLMAGIDAVSLNGYGLHMINCNLYATYNGAGDHSSYYNSFYDVTRGSNYLYSAATYWDPMTGLGCILLQGYVTSSPSKNLSPMIFIVSPADQSVFTTGSQSGATCTIWMYAVSPNPAHPVTTVKVTCAGSNWYAANEGEGYWACGIRIPISPNGVTIQATATNSIGQSSSTSITVYVFYYTGHPKPNGASV